MQSVLQRHYQQMKTPHENKLLERSDLQRKRLANTDGCDKMSPDLKERIDIALRQIEDLDTIVKDIRRRLRSSP